MKDASSEVPYDWAGIARESAAQRALRASTSSLAFADQALNSTNPGMALNSPVNLKSAEVHSWVSNSKSEVKSSNPHEKTSLSQTGYAF
jgi:hypothetical protein